MEAILKSITIQQHSRLGPVSSLEASTSLRRILRGIGFATLALCASGCAGLSRTVDPANMKALQVKSVCVVTNYDLENSIEASINRAIARKGIVTIPVPSVSSAKDASCDAYLVYGGSKEHDFSQFLSRLRIDVFRGEKLIGQANLNVPNNLRLDKWGAAEQEIPKLVDDLFQ